MSTINKVPASAGAEWLLGGFALLRKAPLALGLLGVIWGLLSLLGVQLMTVNASLGMLLQLALGIIGPLLFAGLLWAGILGLRDDSDPVRFIALCGGLVVLGFFVLGFFADTERVSFHWPLPGLVALLPLLPTLLLRWPRWLRVLTWASAGAGSAARRGGNECRSRWAPHH